MEYSLVSNSCISSFIYRLYNPGVHKLFVDYTNPFIAAWFPDDFHYIRFCERYDYYTSLEPRFGEATTCLNWFRDTGRYVHLNRKITNYPVMFLGDVEIHWIHECREKLLLAKYLERLEKSRALEPVFLWSSPEMFNIHLNGEMETLLKRFCDIPRKTLFLTNDPADEQENDNTRVVFVPEWAGKSQFDRHRKNFLIGWYNHPRLAELFKTYMYADHFHNV